MTCTGFYVNEAMHQEALTSQWPILSARLPNGLCEL